MNTLFLVLIIATSIILILAVDRVLISYLAERTVNVRKHIPKWTLELSQNIDLKNIKHIDIRFYTKDNVLIDALLIQSEKLNLGNIIFVHGIRTNKYYYFEEAIFFSKKGFNCILLNLRGHGESEGKYTTFGHIEKNDISMLVDYLTSKCNLPNHYGIWGHSMGASIALQTLELDKRIGFGILEAPFSNLYTIMKEYFEKKLWFLSSLLIKKTLKKVEQISGFKIKDINPARSAKNVEQPTILLHGTLDERINYNHSNIIFNNLPSNNKIIYQINNADHHNIKEVWKNEYFEITYSFINSYIDKFQYTN